MIESLKKPVQTVTFDMSAVNITVSAWVQIISSLTYGASGVEIFNPSGSILKISRGAAGHEDEAVNLFPFTIVPGGTLGLVPLEFHGHDPISIKAIDTNVTQGFFVLNIYA